MSELMMPRRTTDPFEVGTNVLTRLMESQTFAPTPALRVLLLYLWDHRNQPISEYAVATEALGRQASFDPKFDATVRVQISRLRQRMDKFYAEEGHCSVERLSIPLGTHQLKILRCVDETLAEQTPVATVFMPGTLPRRRAIQYVLLITCLAILCISEAIALYRVHSAPMAEAAPPLGWFWKSFLSDGLPVRVILPTPTFL